MDINDLIGETVDLLELLTTRVFDYLLYAYLRNYHPRVFAVMHVMGIMEIVYDDFGHPIKTVHWDRIPLWLSDPGEIAERVYQWDSAFDGDEFLNRFEVYTDAPASLTTV